MKYRRHHSIDILAIYIPKLGCVRQLDDRAYQVLLAKALKEWPRAKPKFAATLTLREWIILLAIVASIAAVVIVSGLLFNSGI